MDPREARLYASKLSSMQWYVPFLEKMISKLERAKDAKDPQLGKMKSLYAILTDPSKKLKLDTLEKCEDVLKKLYQKVEGEEPEDTPPARTPQSPDPEEEDSRERRRKKKESRWSKDEEESERRNQVQEPPQNQPPFGGGFPRPPFGPRGGPPPPGPWMNNRMGFQGGPPPPGNWRMDQPRMGGNWGGGRFPPNAGRGLFGPAPRGMPRPPRFGGGNFPGGRFDGPRFDGFNNGGPPQGRFGPDFPNNGMGFGGPRQAGFNNFGGPQGSFGPQNDFNNPGGFGRDGFNDRSEGPFPGGRFPNDGSDKEPPKNRLQTMFGADKDEDTNNFEGDRRFGDRFQSKDNDRFGGDRSNDRFGGERSNDNFGGDRSNDRFGGGRSNDRFGSSSDRFDSSDRFQSKGDRFEPKGDRFEPKRDRFGSNDRFEPKSDRFEPKGDRFEPKSDRFGSSDRFESKSDRFEPKGNRWDRETSRERTSKHSESSSSSSRPSRFDKPSRDAWERERSRLSKSPSDSERTPSRDSNRVQPEESPSSPQAMETPQSPVDTPLSPVDTPMSPETPTLPIVKSPSSSSLLSSEPKVIPLDKKTKIIPLEKKSPPVRRSISSSLMPKKKVLPLPPASPPPEEQEKPPQESVRSRLMNDSGSIHTLGGGTNRRDPRRRAERSNSPSVVASNPPVAPPTQTEKPPTLSHFPPQMPRNNAPGLLPTPNIPPRPMFRQQQQQQQPVPTLTPFNPNLAPPPRPTNSSQQYRPGPDAMNSPFNQPVRQPRKTFSTYREYRKFKEEQDKRMMEEMKRIEKERKEAEGPTEESEESEDKEEESEEEKTGSQSPAPAHSFGASVERKAVNMEPAAIGKFKIPKKKRASVDSRGAERRDSSSSEASAKEEDIKKASPIQSRKESESDSESELKIVMDQDSHSESEEQPMVIAEPESHEDEPPPPPKKEMTRKEVLLQSLMESLSPDEARKLKKKASKISNDKLSLKELKFLLLDDSDGEEEEKEKKEGEEKKEEAKVEAPKPAKKGRGKSPKAAKPAKVSPTAGTRRSRRLQPSEEEAVKEKVKEDIPTQNDLIDDSDDEDDQLVIDEGLPSKSANTSLNKSTEEVKQPKKDSNSSSKDEEEDAPPKDEENFEVSSAPDEAPVKAKKRGRGRPRKNQVHNDSIKMEEDGKENEGMEVEPKEEEEDEEIPLKVTRSSKQKSSAPKSKTWFPGTRDTRTNISGRRHSFKSPEPESRDAEEGDVVPKKEPKEPDLKVFVGSEDIVLEKTKDVFKTNEPVEAKVAAGSLRERIGSLGSLMQKLKALQAEPSEEKEEAKEEKPMTKEAKVVQDIEPVVVTEEPKQYSDKIHSVIESLRQKVEFEAEPKDDIKLNEPEKVKLLGLVREISSQQRPVKVAKSSDATTLKLDIYTKHKLSHNQSAPVSFKAPDALAFQLDPENISQLFKCFSKNCSYVSDHCLYFKQHIEEHSLEVDQSPFKGWRCCVYCNLTFKTPEKLVLHIVAIHGSCCFQCPHCYHRAGSGLALMIHQHALHKGKQMGFISCKALPNAGATLMHIKAPPIRCRDCKFQSACEDTFRSHLKTHHSGYQEHSEIVCWHCGSAFERLPLLTLHSALMHTSEPIVCGVRYIDIYNRTSEEISESSDSEEEEEVEEVSVNGVEENDDDLGGLAKSELYKCGYHECQYSADNVADFQDHLAICDFSVDQPFLTCHHCSKQFKHTPTLLEHLKTHGQRRYYCSLCTFRGAGGPAVKNHMRTAHRALNAKVLPANPLRTNPDLDRFVVVPRNSVVKSLNQSRSSFKEFFAPGEEEAVPRSSMFRTALKCSICDFGTRVRNNLLKHLKLHQVEKRKEEEEEDARVPLITPINAPSVSEDDPAKTKMTNLLDCDADDRFMSDQDMELMPKLVEESHRFSCCEFDCQYITIDAVMLAYHIEALHSHRSTFSCPHCLGNRDVSFEDLEFHLRCHGDLLFKCAHCDYYHWQKRTAEKHVSDQHPHKKQFVRNVRYEEKEKARVKQERQQQSAGRMTMKAYKPKAVPTVTVEYHPYKCALCDHADETLEGIKEHCARTHELSKQFKCSLCNEATDEKADMQAHVKEKHHNSCATIVRVHYIDCSKPCEEERRDPLWSRNMPGLKHIRGILYDEEPAAAVQQQAVPRKKGPKGKSSSSAPGPFAEAPIPGAAKAKKKANVDDEADNFPMSCRDCGLAKKTVKGLKMHIKLLHLRTGRFRCKRCQFSANILNSIHTHYKIKHPESEPDFEERSDEPRVFGHEFWKAEWGIPTLQERKEMVLDKEEGGAEQEEEVVGVAKKRPLEGGAEPRAKRGKKKGVKRKQPCQSMANIAGHDVSEEAPAAKMALTERQLSSPKANHIEPSAAAPTTPLPEQSRKALEQRIMETSPYELVPTYKCLFCPKRSQDLDRIERHLASEHADKSDEEEKHKVMTRDQVVDMLTLKQSAEKTSADFKCFYCEDVVGSILRLKEHFESEHPQDSLKVKSFQGKGVSGYLECQICGHLTEGFERSKQKVHFHEEHPLEAVVNASKYVLKSKAKDVSADTNKVDLSRFNGMGMSCPKADCSFEAKTISAMSSHLKRHTQTFKCGHCGKTHPNSPDFHRHSAMMHGDKIPDLIKDPEADAEFEALKALFEADLTAKVSANNATAAPPQSKSLKQPTARKSTGQRRQDLKNVAKKSTGYNFHEYSYYGLPVEKVDLDSISTTMSFGGMAMSLKASKMADLIKLDPKVYVEDHAKKNKK